MPVDIAGFAYAAVVAAGGVFGYYRAGNLFIKQINCTTNQQSLL